jgi:hypothetical protein
MTDEVAGDLPSSEAQSAKQPWSPPTIDVIDVEETKGPSPAFPVVDSVTGMS